MNFIPYVQNISYFFFISIELLINNLHIYYLWNHLKVDMFYPLQIEIFIKSSSASLYVKALQDIISINPFLEEATLLFFRFHNNSADSLILLTTYSIIPYEMYLYFIKLQCFCFDKIQIKPYQTLDLPILFCLSKDNVIKSFENIVLIYNVFVIS